MTKSDSRVDQLLRRLKDNRVVAILIVAGLGVISLASFTDALTTIWNHVSKIGQADVTGQWRSVELTDVRTEKRFSYLFDLNADDGRVYGTGRRIMPYCEKRPQSGMCAGYGEPVGINDGKIDGKKITFSCEWELPGASPWTWVNVRETFHGTVDRSGIDFVQQDDKKSVPVRFRALRTAQQETGDSH